MSIFIHHGAATLEIRKCDLPSEASSPATLEQQIDNLMGLGRPYSLIQSTEEASTLAQIAVRFQWIEAAGGIIKNSNGQYLLIHRRGHRDLPKGKIDSGETALEAAHREIAEETGLNHLHKLAECPPTYHIYRLQEKWFLKKTHWFVFELETDQSLVLQTEEDIIAAQWMSPSEIRSCWGEIYPSLYSLLETVIG